MPREESKVLSFTDNRQDASLQAGHLNDFVQVAQLRAAIVQAMRQKPCSHLPRTRSNSIRGDETFGPRISSGRRWRRMHLEAAISKAGGPWKTFWSTGRSKT